jgi:hypothetical protein
VPVEHQLTFDVPKALLDLAAVEIPIGVVAADGTGAIADTSLLEFDTERWLKDASLILPVGEAFVGRPVPFQIAGLSPGSTFDLFLDEALLLSAVLDPAGGFSGSFVFPSDPGEGPNHFLTAQDSTGEFAFNVIFVPAPPSIIVLAVGLGVLGARLRQRRRPR